LPIIGRRGGALGKQCQRFVARDQGDLARQQEIGRGEIGELLAATRSLQNGQSVPNTRAGSRPDTSQQKRNAA
jgi:hypothetical protein